MNLNSNGWNADDHIVVAVSTGIDSMSLLHSLIHEYHHTYQQLTCLHVNHGLREASDDEENFFKAFCKQNNLNYFIKRLDLSDLVAQDKSIQNESRKLRYEWFDDMMHQLNADVLLTAHHQDDQIETIFYRVFTGRSTRSRLGMAYTSDREGYQLCRPLLEVSKSEIKEYQQQHHFSYFEDSSNASNKYVRNDIRNRILPEINRNEQLEAVHLLKLKEWHDAQMDVLENQVQQFIDSKVEINREGIRIQFSRQAFNQLEYHIEVALLDRLLRFTDVLQPVPEKRYREWFQQIKSETSQFIISLSEQWHIKIAYDKFIIMVNKNHFNQSESFYIEQPGTYRFNSYDIHIDADIPNCHFPFIVRNRQNGDVIELNGQIGHKKVNRLFIDHKIETTERNEMPIIVNQSNQIVAVGNIYTNQRYQSYLKIKNGDEL